MKTLNQYFKIVFYAIILSFSTITSTNAQDGLEQAANGSIELKKGRNGDPSIILKDGKTTGWKRIGSDGPLAFWANGKVESDNAAQLILTSSGRLGIGTTGPLTRLQINPQPRHDHLGIYDPKALLITHPTPTSNTTLNDPKDVLYLTREGTAGQAYGAKAKFSLSRFENGGYRKVGSRTRLDMSLAHDNFNDVNIMTLLSNGNVGIGTTTPTKKLDVAGDINFTGDLYKKGELFNPSQIVEDTVKFKTGTVKVGNDAGKDITATGDHVFIGKGAGTKESFAKITVIDYEDEGDTNPITGNEYLTKHSVFVVNNHEDLEKPLLFGNFSKEGDADPMAQLAINTHHVVANAALTVSGAVHIGPKNLNPTTFPSEKGYDDALLWVEKGIVTEELVYAFSSDWDSWPDYVFEKGYDLMELNELEKYINKEKHLPGIASVDQIKEEGLKSRETIASLLLKIEELTLYTIDQEKRIDSQNKLNQTLLDRLEAIENRLNN